MGPKTSVFDFKESYVLENDRVRMAPLTLTDIASLQPIAEEDGVWTYFLGASNGKDRLDAYVRDAIAHRKDNTAYTFSIQDKKTKAFIGSTRFFDFDLAHNTVRLGYTWIGNAYRGTGINKHCKYLMFQFAFEEIGFERIGLGAHAQNEVSIAAMKSLGCKEEGRIRNLFPAIHGPGRADAVLLGMLKEEWLLFAKEELKRRL